MNHSSTNPSTLVVGTSQLKPFSLKQRWQLGLETGIWNLVGAVLWDWALNCRSWRYVQVELVDIQLVLDHRSLVWDFPLPTTHTLETGNQNPLKRKTQILLSFTFVPLHSASYWLEMKATSVAIVGHHNFKEAQRVGSQIKWSFPLCVVWPMCGVAS